MKISIKSLLLLMIIVALPIAGVINRYRGKRLMDEFANQHNGQVRWNYEQSGWYDSYSPSKHEHSGPEWIRSIWGDDACAWIRQLSLKLDQANVAQGNRRLSNGASLRGMVELALDVSDAADEFDYSTLAGLRDVRWFTLHGGRLDRSAMMAISKMEDLETLNLFDCTFEVDDVQVLKNAPHLAWLQVSYANAKGERIKTIRASLPKTFISYSVTPQQ